MQSRDRINQEFGRAGTERAAIVFVSASVEDARAFREIAGGSRWLVVNVPDLIGGQAAIDKLRPRLVVCDIEIEGGGSWRDLLKGQGAALEFALIVATPHAGEALIDEVFDLGGADVLEKPFRVESVERVLGLARAARYTPAR
jgi:DNA-binding NarL/FixJ family response regulator